jgi:hypothetical protein
MSVPCLVARRAARAIRWQLIARRVAAGIALPASLAVAQSDSSSSVTLTGSDIPAYTSPYVGVSGTGGTTLSCPSLYSLVGIAGTRLKFVQKITAICASFTKDGLTARVTTLDPTAVGTGAAGFTLQCPSGRVVARLRVAYHTDTALYPFLGGVEISCGLFSLGTWSTPLQPIAMSNFDGWPRKDLVTCTSPKQPVRALRVRATTSVKALGIVCDEPWS